MESPQSQPPASKDESVFDGIDYSMKGYDKPVRRARIILYIIAGMQLLPLFMLGEVIDETSRMLVIGSSIFSSVVFAGLAFWSRTKPYPALLMALVFYGVLLALAVAFTGWGSLLQGVIVKAVVVVLLIAGIRNAKEAEDVRKTFGNS